MKKLSAKQRPRPPQPRRKTSRPPRVVTRRPRAGLLGFLVRLPPEPNPHETRSGQPPVPVYLGWRGRALHLNLAIAFAEEAKAVQAAASFPGSVVERCNVTEILEQADPLGWLTIAIPDPIERKRTFHVGQDLDSAEIARRAELADRLFDGMTIPDERAPQDETVRNFVIDAMLQDEEVEFQLLGG